MTSASTEKRVPMRQCMGCREHKPKSEFIRVLRKVDGTVLLDSTGRQPGRGTYVCKSAECFKRIRKSRALDRSLHANISDDIYSAIEKEINNG